MRDLFRLTEARLERLRPYFPKTRGIPSVDDRRVPGGIIFVNRNGLRWRDAPAEYGPQQDIVQPVEALEQAGCLCPHA